MLEERWLNTLLWGKLKWDGKMRVYGRIIKKFTHKKVTLLLVNCEGTELRCVIKHAVNNRNSLDEEAVSIGDYVYCCGVLQNGKDEKNEMVIDAIRVIKKCDLRPVETGLLPDSQYKGTKLKQFYHTMMLNNTDSVCYLKARSSILDVLFRTMIDRGFCHISTPVLQHNFYAGGARPFITHMKDNASDMYLRITSEVALKLIMIGGMEKAFEIGDYFRNGSINEMHGVPFCAMEAYQTQVTYNQLQKMAEELLKKITDQVVKVLQDFDKPLIIDFRTQILEYTFEEFVHLCGYEDFDISDLKSYPDIPELKEKTEDVYINSRVLYKWFKESLIKSQINPIWISDLPTGQSPFIKKKDKYRLYRKYLVAGGTTLVEVTQGETDHQVIEENLYLQQVHQSTDYPRDYRALLHAYKLGTPEICSLFISVDRLYSIFTGDNDINKYKMYI